MKLFYRLLGNTALTSITHFTIWFAITFYYIAQTKSVLVAGVMAGLYLVLIASTGIWFGSLVDHHKKRSVMIVSNIAAFGLYFAALILYLATDKQQFANPASIELWALAILVLAAVTAGNLRGIALPTLTTILVPEDIRDKANGLVGTVNGVSFLITSAISGILVAYGGMLYVLWLAIIVMVISTIDLFLTTIPEKGIVHVDGAPKKVDLKGTFKVVQSIPGLLPLIIFSTFNNFLGGVFMALMDAYGLSMMSVTNWGFFWAILSTGMIIGGLIIAKTGLGKNPVRTLLLMNVGLWAITILFPLNASIIPLAIGMYLYMLAIPSLEASEQTILQRVVPIERQGRVFGFAQSVEQSASPLTAFLIGPITQLFFIPFMTTGAGVELIGDWFGTGPNRGIALVFVLTGVIGLAVSIYALNSRYFRQLSKKYLASHQSADDSSTTAAPTAS